MEDDDAKPVVNLAETQLPNAIRALDISTLEFPTGQDFHFYFNFQEFRAPVAQLQSRVAVLLNQLGSLKDLRSRPASFPTDVDEGYEWLVGVQDDLLERVDAALERFDLDRKDYFRGMAESKTAESSSKRKIVVAAEGIKSGDVKVARSSKDKGLLRSPIPFHVRTIPRPQDKFDMAVDNSNTPFKHIGCRERILPEPQACSSPSLHNADSALTESAAVLPGSVLEKHARKVGVKGGSTYIHPLEEELMKMDYDMEKEVIKYDSLEKTPFSLVTTLRSLKEMGVKLREAGEIAVDLENHYYRSFQGFVCLMQVSTRDEDFVVDTLELRSQIGPVLGDIFSDTKILKVMHGSDQDIMWLQRDFGIYVCNMFDTGQAARVLQLPGFGLGYLLEHFCEVHADKRYQLADWRIRPLPAEMLKYAREDTHYLLYVHDMLKKLLLAARAELKGDEEDPVLQVCKRSRDICLQLYFKEIFTETSYQQLYGLHEKKFRPEQVAVLASLYAWRNQVARKEDESTGYVLPNHLLFVLATEMPDNVRTLQSFLKGSDTFVGRKAAAVVEIIVQAKEKALRELEDTLPEHLELSQEGKYTKEKLIAGDEVATVIKKGLEEVAVEISNTDPQREGEKPETLPQACNLIKQNEIIEAKGEAAASSEATVTDQIDVLGSAAVPSVPDTSYGVEQMKLTLQKQSGPVVVTRKTPSSLFATRPRKSTSLSAPSLLLSMPPETSGVSESIHTFVPSAVSTGNLISADEDLTNENFKAQVADIGHLPGQAEDQTTSGNTAGNGAEFTTPQSLFPLRMEVPADSSVDTTFYVPEITSPQISVKPAEEDLPNSSTNAMKVVKNLVILQPQQNISKLGGLLGGRSRLQSSKDFAQVEARIKTKDIESSLVLPFASSVRMLPGAAQLIAPNSSTGKAEIIVSRSEVTLTNSIHELNNGERVSNETNDKETENAAAPGSEDVLMFEPEDDEDSPDEESRRTTASGAVAEDLEKSPKQQKWWTSAVEGVQTLHRKDDDSSTPVARDPLSEQHLEESGHQRNSQFPASLSEMHSKSKHGNRNRHHRGKFEARAHPENSSLNMKGQGRSKKRGREQTPTSAHDPEVQRRGGNSDTRVGDKKFSYKEARSNLGIEDLYVERTDTMEGQSSRGRGRGRGSTRGNSRPPTRLNKSAFDPLRRVRVDPKPEGIQPGKRRQVFPQSGNREMVFKQ